MGAGLNRPLGREAHNVRACCVVLHQAEAILSTPFEVDEKWVRCPDTNLRKIAEGIADGYGKEDDVTVLVIRRA